jgi:hypothetical protein
VKITERTTKKGELKMRNTIMSFAKKFTGKEVKNMKSLLSIVIAITMVISTSGLSFAAYERLGSPKEFTATSGEVLEPDDPITIPLEALLKNISDNEIAGSATWSAVTAGVTGWKAANQYIEVEGWTVHSDWGIQIYTNNTNYTGTGDPAGLIRQGDAETIHSLPMAWRTKTDLIDPATSSGAKYLEITQMVDPESEYVVLTDGHYDASAPYYPWFFMLDKRTVMDAEADPVELFGNYQNYATFIGSKGYQHAPTDYASPWATDTKYYIYLGANFTMAAAGKTYTTTTLTIEMYKL